MGGGRKTLACTLVLSYHVVLSGPRVDRPICYSRPGSDLVFINRDYLREMLTSDDQL